MFHVVLYQPEIPPNTGNVIRLCANTGARLHLVQPLGFTLEDKQLKRAGLDYHEMTNVQTHVDWAACRRALGEKRIFAASTRGEVAYADVRYEAGDAFVFGAETAGLPDAFLEEFDPARRLRLPMRPGNRSLNLSNAVAVVVFEAWRQLGFDGAA
ncbi:tRNA (cytidine(34)-2'-O)-methyltransferase [Usitatibacter rugosus]|uniref:tRNA (cytidine(34)-2'-O)-methyltransferase n=1 Tax=Usitatibacter rugosus TaxID=2732067 RepID=A0A6M4GRH9_9PROT|nr:tRNA (cytidine(34)-2'-O)-methyltransferase [Usitatibacter rugosus]QJR09665.1 tRNA (cytidine(34)-2'-O)-methyltransferase [Usitatibacter rugosus]